jgi:2-methylisocitrate lyase-like PEP mutase family enzyme
LNGPTYHLYINHNAGKPLKLDVQHGYGDQLGEAISRVIEPWCVGVSLEDYDKENKQIYTAEAAVIRILRSGS